MFSGQVAPINASEYLTPLTSRRYDDAQRDRRRGALAVRTGRRGLASGTDHGRDFYNHGGR